MVCDIWKQKNWSTVRDLLIYYNNLDVVPFVQAVENLLKKYKSQNLDLFKQAFSVSGIAKIIMFKEVDSDALMFSFLSFPKNTKTSIKCLEISYAVASPRCSQGKQSKMLLKFAPTKLRTLAPARQVRAWSRQRYTSMQRLQKLLLDIMFVIKKAMISDPTLSINSDFPHTNVSDMA